MRKITYKDFFKSPINILLVLILILSIFTGILFVIRIVSPNSSDKNVEINEINDTLVYYEGSYTSNEILNKYLLILNDKNSFTLAITTDKTNVYTGVYVENEGTYTLYSNSIADDNIKNDYRIFNLYLADDDSLHLSLSSSGEEVILINKDKNNISGFNVNNVLSLSTKPKYLYSDNDKETILNNIFDLKSIYDVVKFIDRLTNDIVGPNPYVDQDGNLLLESLYSSSDLYINNLSNYNMLSFIMSNLDESNFSIDLISNLSKSIFNRELDFTLLSNITFRDYTYELVDGRFVKTGNIENAENRSNIIKLIYDTYVIDNKLYVKEIYSSYDCANGSCKFYPYNLSSSDFKDYYDFTTNSIDSINLLSNIDKMKTYTWVFNINPDGNYTFESISLN